MVRVDPRPERVLAYGPPGGGAGDAILRREVAPRLSGPDFASFWFVTRGGPRRHEAARFAAAARRVPALPGCFFTLSELSAACAARLDDSTPSVGRAERRVLIAECVGPRTRPGLAQAIARTLTELLAADVRDPDALPPGILRETWQRYRQRLSALGMADPDAALTQVAAALASGRLRVPELVVIEGLYQPRRAEEAFVRALAQRARRLVLVADLFGAPDALAPADAVWAPLVELARTLGARMEAVGSERLGALPQVARRLFGPPAEVRPTLVGSELRIGAYADRRAEVDGIATEVRAQVAAGTPAGEIVIALPALAEYAPLLRERLPRFGVPFDLLRGDRLFAAPLVRAAFALGEAVLKGFERSAVEHALGCPYVRFGALQYLRLDRQARAAGVVGGGGSAAVEAEWLAPLARWAQIAPAGSDEEIARELARRDAEFVLKQLPLLADALRALAQLEKARPPRQAARTLATLWERFGLGKLAAPEIDPELTRHDLAAYQRLRAVLAQAASGLELGGAEKVDLPTLLGALRIAVAEETYATAAPTRADRVRVLGLHDLPGVACRCLFVGGLQEAAFPPAPAPALLLSEPDRRRLGLTTYDDTLAELRHLFALAVAGPQDAVALSLVRGELSREDAASSFLYELGRHAQVELCDRDPPSGPEAAYTEERRQRLLARARSSALAAAGMAEPEAVEAAIRAESAREEAALSAWDGRLLADPVSDGLRAAVLADLSVRVLGSAGSVTQLDTYASCPFRFFAGYLLRLAPLEDPLEVSAALTGHIVHATLCDFYRSLRDAGPVGARLFAGPAAFGSGEAAERAWVDAARAPIGAACRRQLERLAPPTRDAFYDQIEQRLLAGLEGGVGPAGLLLAFLRSEARALWRLEPIAFELPFGQSRHHDPDGERRLPAFEVEVSGQAPVRLQGALDRVDRLRVGGAAVMLDYKTGRYAVPRPALIAQGYRFQLPVYLAALSSWLEAEAAGYYLLTDPAEVRRKLVFGPEALDVGALRQRLPLAVSHLARAARGGQFHPGHLPERDKGCTFCDFAAVCRVDHDRMLTLSVRRATGMMLPLPLVEAP